MHHAAAVRFIQRVGNLCGILKNLFQRQRAFEQARGQRLAFQILHDQEINAVLLADIVQHADVGMIQARDNFGFALEALAQSRVAREMRRQNLDGYGALEARIARAIHHTHAPRAQWRGDFIGTESCAIREGHSWPEYTPGRTASVKPAFRGAAPELAFLTRAVAQGARDAFCRGALRVLTRRRDLHGVVRVDAAFPSLGAPGRNRRGAPSYSA